MMSNPFTFEEDDDESNPPLVLESESSEDSNGSDASNRGTGGSDNNSDVEMSSNLKRMKTHGNRIFQNKKKCLEKIALQEDPINTLFRNEEVNFGEDTTEFDDPFKSLARPAFCAPNRSQDKLKPSQCYLLPEQLRVNKFEQTEVEENEAESEALEHTDESLRRKREDLNKKLQAEPQNVDLWLEFVKFQDTMCAQEKLQSSTSSSGSLSLDRVYAEKKLSILDKALKMNPNSEPLSNARYHIMKRSQPVDKMLQDLKVLLGKQRTNLYLHREYLRALQHNMNRNSVDTLLDEYHHAIQMTDRKQALSTLLEFGNFLKQAGLWEILLCVLQQYLEENLNNAKHFDMGLVFTLPELTQEEEQKFLSDELAWISSLDRTELSSWIRVETERSSVHFLPVATISTCIDDTERYCLPDDVIKFVRPVPSSEYLLSVSLSLLKVPPLPLSHSAWVLCSLGSVDSCGSDVELLTTGHFSLLSHLDTQTCTCPLSTSSSSPLPSLSSPPSYLFPSPHHSHLRYREVILAWWRTAVNLMDDYQQIPMYVWLFRFVRHLFHSTQNETDRKELYDKSKLLLKDILKEDKFRSAVPLYVEFAYFERDYGKPEEGVKVLKKLLDSILTCDSSEIACPSASILTAVRSLALLMLQSNQKTEALLKYKQLLCTIFHIDGTSSTPSLLSTIKSAIEADLSSLNTREELFFRSLYENHRPTELILAGAWLLYLDARVTSENSRARESSENESSSCSGQSVHSFLASHTETLGLEVSGSLDVGFLMKETLAEQLCLFLADDVRTSTSGSEDATGGPSLIKLKYNLTKYGEMFPNNATLCHLASVHHASVLTRTPHVLPNVLHTLITRDPGVLIKQSTGSELVARVALYAHRHWHEKSAGGEYACDCNVFGLLDRVPSSKALYMAAIEYFCSENNERQAMDLHGVMIEKHLRVHIPYEMVKVLGGGGS